MKWVWRVLWVVSPFFIGFAAYGLIAGYGLLIGRPGDVALRALDYVALVDLGECEREEPTVARFAMTNRSRQEIIVYSIRSACSCSGLGQADGPVFVRQDSIKLPPESRTEVAAQIRPNAPVGQSMESTITFATTDPRQPSGKVTLRIGKITGGISTTPPRIVFGSVTVGVRKTQVVDVHDGTLSPSSIARVTSSDPDRLQVSLLEQKDTTLTETESAPVLGRLEVTLVAAAPGHFREYIEIHANDTGLKPRRVEVTGHVVSAVQASPSALVFPRASEHGPTFQATCLCRSTEGLALTLALDKLPVSLLAKIQPVEGSPATKLVLIEWKPTEDQLKSEVPTRLAIRLRARVAGKEDESLVIPVYCERPGRKKDESNLPLPNRTTGL